MEMNFTLGQKVGIARTGSWTTMLEGMFTVTKVNKVRVELSRVNDGYVRTFSVKTGRESGQYTSDRTYLISEADYSATLASQEVQRVREQAFATVRNLIERKVGRSGISRSDYITLREAVAALDQYTSVD